MLISTPCLMMAMWLASAWACEINDLGGAPSPSAQPADLRRLGSRRLRSARSTMSPLGTILKVPSPTGRSHSRTSSAGPRASARHRSACRPTFASGLSGRRGGDVLPVHACLALFSALTSDAPRRPHQPAAPRRLCGFLVPLSGCGGSRLAARLCATPWRPAELEALIASAATAAAVSAARSSGTPSAPAMAPRPGCRAAPSRRRRPRPWSPRRSPPARHPAARRRRSGRP